MVSDVHQFAIDGLAREIGAGEYQGPTHEMFSKYALIFKYLGFLLIAVVDRCSVSSALSQLFPVPLLVVLRTPTMSLDLGL